MCRLARDKNGNIERDEQGFALFEQGVRFFYDGKEHEYFPQDNSDNLSAEDRKAHEWARHIYGWLSDFEQEINKGEV